MAEMDKDQLREIAGAISKQLNGDRPVAIICLNEEGEQNSFCAVGLPYKDWVEQLENLIDGIENHDEDNGLPPMDPEPLEDDIVGNEAT